MATLLPRVFRVFNRNFSSSEPLVKALELRCRSVQQPGYCRVILVGTVHKEMLSHAVVKEIITLTKPETVFVEVCKSREGLTSDKRSEISEFYTAARAAEECGAELILGDQPCEVTWRMMWPHMPPHVQMCFDYDLEEFGSLKRMIKTRDMPPRMIAAFHTQRDMYMVTHLLGVARERRSIVCVVGRAHLPGICRLWRMMTRLEQH